jgi:hypothetical protein
MFVQAHFNPPDPHYSSVYPLENSLAIVFLAFTIDVKILNIYFGHITDDMQASFSLWNWKFAVKPKLNSFFFAIGFIYVIANDLNKSVFSIVQSLPPLTLDTTLNLNSHFFSLVRCN